jgi:hypothetical protein
LACLLVWVLLDLLVGLVLLDGARSLIDVIFGIYIYIFLNSFILFYFFQNVLSFEKRFVFYFEKCISDRNYARLILKKEKKRKERKKPFRG